MRCFKNPIRQFFKSFTQPVPRNRAPDRNRAFSRYAVLQALQGTFPHTIAARFTEFCVFV